MSLPSTEDQTFEHRDTATEPLPIGIYINCVFRNCQFSNANFMDCRFTECRFEDCDLSNAEVAGTAFQEVTFHGCRLLGIAWEDCKPLLLQLRFEKCQLDYGVFGALPMEGTAFLGCSVRETDFTGTRLKEADFSRSDLTNARFEGAQLQNADFRMAENFTIHPEHNDLKDALFARQEAWRLLQSYGLKFE
jgi:uncharacterized protein YjbI with pentapeptide repeats